VDPLRVDPALGGEDALRKLLDDAHARGMRVIVDLALTHAGRGYPPYEDVLIHGRASRYAGLFQWTRGDDPELVHYGSRRDAPLLNLASPEARALAERAAAYWAGLGVDGLRLDAAADVPIDLARSIRRRLRERCPEAVLVGEVVPLHAWRWIAEEAVDTATDFVFHAAVTDFVAHRSIDAAELERRLAAIAWTRGGPPEASLRFVSTHDHPRLATLARLAKGPERARLGLLLLLTSPGVPALLYGEEIGLASDDAELQPENVWPDRMPMPLGEEAGDTGTRALVRDLIALRRKLGALARGDTEILHAEGGVFVYRRSAGAEVIDIAVNVSDDRVEIAIEDEGRPSASLLASAGEASIEGPRVWLGPASGAVIRREVPGAAAGRRRLFALANGRLRDAEAAEGALSVRSRPSRIDLSVTERCNLSCLHCITLAPERTREGTARTLSPWLLDRLRDAFDTAAYVGFVHGGEPLAAPILFDVLGAVRAARGDSPTVIHLLTNGILLTERTAARLIEAGVSSISVSLDGASAATNDAIRAGGRFDQITANVRRVTSLRRSLAADLRIGVSSVLMQQNAGEIERLVELCADLGVDWLKLEEAVPATPFAARSLLRELSGRARAVGEGEPPVLQAIRRAAQRGRELGVLVVDHTADRTPFRCKLPEDPALEEAWRADEFANRSEIHPCRVPWEHACVEPNGDIKMGDFFGAVLGSLADEPLSSIWNGPRALAERQRSLLARLCGAAGAGVSPVTCGLIR
jgi:MoaA/NifB/PqqE/SkfB family radical SAM enzyme